MGRKNKNISLLNKVYGKNSFNENLSLNQRTYYAYLDWLSEIFLSRFVWSGLPKTANPRLLELFLMSSGYCLFFKDPVMGELVMECNVSGNTNLQGDAVRRDAYGYNGNGYHRTLSDKDSVLIYNNYLRTSSWNRIELYAQRLTECDRSEDVNIKNQKTPKIILCEEQQRLTMLNLMQKYSGNEPFIYGDKNLDIEGIIALDISAPFIADKVNIHKHNIFNEFLTYCGVENANADKRERLVADEVGANSGAVEMSRNTMLMAREQACEQINDMFNLNVSVKFNSSLASMVNMPMQFYKEKKEGVEN